MADRPARERASVLMLVPAAVLVLFVLGAIAVDFAVAFLAQRELSNAAAAAANDAATAALSDEVFYRGSAGGPEGTIEIDDAAAERIVRQALEASGPRGISDVDATVRAPGNQVCVTITGRVTYIFAKAVPGGPRGTMVTGRAVATAVRGGERPSRGDDVC